MFLFSLKRSKVLTVQCLQGIFATDWLDYILHGPKPLPEALSLL